MWSDLKNNVYICKIKLIIMDGLRIKKGQLINHRENSEIGLLQVAKARKAMKRVKKEECIANAIELAERRKAYNLKYIK